MVPLEYTTKGTFLCIEMATNIAALVSNAYWHNSFSRGIVLLTITFLDVLPDNTHLGTHNYF